MHKEEIKSIKTQLMEFAKDWNEMYAAERFDEMKCLATEDVGIANANASQDPSGLIFGREAYKQGICEACYGKSGKEHNLLVMNYEDWQYTPLGPNHCYTIGCYSLQPDVEGVNCWLMVRESENADWKIFRVINN